MRVRRWAPSALLGAVVVVALAFGVRDRDSKTEAQRVQAIAESVACPACSGQSVASSDAPAAANLRNDIERRVAAGESDDEIRAAYAERFGDEILLNPPRSGAGAVVWVLPVVAVAAAGAGLVVAFRRWRPGPTRAGRARTVVTIVVIAAVGVGGGLAVAAFSGARQPGEQLSGDVPETSDQRLTRAAQLFQDGDARGAIELYQEVLDENPEDLQALTYLGWTLRNVAGDDERLLGAAVGFIEQALDVDPTFAEAWFFRGIIYLRDEDESEQAVDALRLALANDPGPEVEAAARELLAEIAQSDGP